MNEYEKEVIYPFDSELLPIIKHKNLIKNYKIVGLVSPTGWGYNSSNEIYMDFMREGSIEVHSELNHFFSNCDTVLFSDSYTNLDFENDIFSQMVECVKMKKNILSFLNIDSKYQKRINKLCKENGVYFKNYLVKVEKDFDKIISESIIKISTPIIFVLGVAQKTQKFEIQLALREKFINEGYKVSQIGSRRYSEFLGFHSFPDFMYNHSIGEINKIVLFNRLIAQIEMEEKPDVIIIGIPGGVMKLNNIMTNKFGVFSYEISQAVTPDVAIFSTFYEDYTPEYFMRINNSIKYKLGYEVDCFNLANVQFDWDNAHEVQRPVYLTLSSKFIDEKIESFKQGDVPLFNVLNESDTENMFRFIVDKLSDYSHIEII